jgi:hypothetical protein
VAFQTTGTKRLRTARQIEEFVANGMTTPHAIRNNVRVDAMPPLNHFVAPDGSRVACEVLNIALGGAYLKTEVKPAVGEVLGFGQTAGRVLRHTAIGIAVEFVGQAATKA